MFGMAQVEAMSFGKPIVGTYIPNSGVHEVNLHAITGLLVPVMDSAAIADAIISLKNDPERRQAMGKAGRERAAKFYDKSIVIPKFISLFRSCIRV